MDTGNSAGKRVEGMKGVVVMEKRFLDVRDIMNILGYKECSAYNVIRILNKELLSQGFMVKRGVVPRKYFVKRFGIS